MEKVSDVELRHRLRSRDTMNREKRLITELLLARAVASRADSVWKECTASPMSDSEAEALGDLGIDLAAYDAIFTAPAPPADPTPEDRVSVLQKDGFVPSHTAFHAIADAIRDAEQAAAREGPTDEA